MDIRRVYSCRLQAEARPNRIHQLGDEIATPLLIVQGSADAQNGSSQADEIFVGLRVLGKEAEYASYINEGHAPSDWSYANQIDLAMRTIA